MKTGSKGGEGGWFEAIRKENNWRMRSTGVQEDNTHNNNPQHKQQYRRRFIRTPTTPPKTTTHPHPQQQHTKHTGGRQPQHTLTDATLLVPHTPGSKLCTKLQEVENQIALATNSPKIRMVEKGCNKLVHILERTDPDQNEIYCGRSECQSCLGRQCVQEMLKYMKSRGQPTKDATKKWASVANCRREGIIYRVDCLPCLKGENETGEKSCAQEMTRETECTYVGESSISAYERMQEHKRALDKGDTSSPLVEHSITHHGCTKREFIMRCTGTDLQALRRLVSEAVHIAAKAVTIISMNMKHELGVVPRLTVAGGGGDKRLNNKNNDNEKESMCAQDVKKLQARRKRTEEMLSQIAEGKLKRIIWKDEKRKTPDNEEDNTVRDRKEATRRAKRPRCEEDNVHSEIIEVEEELVEEKIEEKPRSEQCTQTKTETEINREPKPMCTETKRTVVHKGKASEKPRVWYGGRDIRYKNQESEIEDLECTQKPPNENNTHKNKKNIEVEIENNLKTIECEQSKMRIEIVANKNDEVEIEKGLKTIECEQSKMRVEVVADEKGKLEIENDLKTTECEQSKLRVVADEINEIEIENDLKTIECEQSKMRLEVVADVKDDVEVENDLKTIECEQSKMREKVVADGKNEVKIENDLKTIECEQSNMRLEVVADEKGDVEVENNLKTIEC